MIKLQNNRFVGFIAVDLMAVIPAAVNAGAVAPNLGRRRTGDGLRVVVVIGGAANG